MTEKEKLAVVLRERADVCQDSPVGGAKHSRSYDGLGGECDWCGYAGLDPEMVDEAEES